MRRQIGAHHAVAHAPTGHGVGLGETVEQNAALLHAVDRHDGMMLAFEDEAAVDLVGQHHDVAIADRARDALDVVLLQHAAGRILRRIQDDELRAVVDQTRRVRRRRAGNPSPRATGSAPLSRRRS